MPRKFMFTREEIIAAALELTRKGGMTALTARALGAELGSSSRPIFGLFKNMEEVQQEVIKAAKDLYQSCLEEDMASGKYPPYKASGMAYIRFSREEKELFKLLFMRDRSHERIEEDREEIRPLLEIIRQKLGLDEEDAYYFHLEMWVYVHGIATMLATSYLEWDEEFISRIVTDGYEGMKVRYAKAGQDFTLNNRKYYDGNNDMDRNWGNALDDRENAPYKASPKSNKQRIGRKNNGCYSNKKADKEI